MLRRTATAIFAASCLVLGLVGQDKRPPQPGQPSDFLGLNSKLSATYSITKFDKKLGGANVLIDPYYGQRQNPKSDEVSYKQILTFEETMMEGGNERIFNLSSETSARFNDKWDLTSFVFEYRFAGEVYKAAYEPEKQAEVFIEKKGQANPVKLAPSAKEVLVGFTPEICFLQLVQTKRLQGDTRHKFLLVLPADRDMVLQEVQFRSLGPETRRYADRLINVHHFIVEEPPEFFSLRHFYVDGYGRLLEYTTSDETRVFLSSETQFTRCDKELDTWYKLIYVIPQNQDERHIGWFNSTLTPDANGLTYKAERILKRTFLEVVRDFRETWNIALTPTYQVEKMTYTRSFATTELKAEYNAQTRKVTYVLNDGAESSVEVPPERNFYGTVDLAAFVLAQKEELLKANLHSATVLDPDSRNVSTVSIALKGAVLRDYLEGRVYTLQTQVAVEDEVRAEIYLDKYGRAMEVSLKERQNMQGRDIIRDGLRTIVTRSSLTAKGGAKEPTPPSVFSNPFSRKTLETTVPPWQRKLEELERGYSALNKLWQKMQDAIKTGNKPEIRELYPKVKEALERFHILLADYSKEVERQTGDVEVDGRVPLWEEQAKKIAVELEGVIDKGEAVETQFKALLEKVVGLLKQNKLTDAQNLVDDIEAIIDHPDAPPPMRQRMLKQWEPVKAWMTDLEIEIRLSRVNFEIPAIAWELDNIERPVRVRFDLFGSGLDYKDTIKVARVRAYAVMNNKIYREGDTVEAEGLKLTVSRIEKDKVTVKVGRFVKEFLIRQ